MKRTHFIFNPIVAVLFLTTIFATSCEKSDLTETTSTTVDTTLALGERSVIYTAFPYNGVWNYSGLLYSGSCGTFNANTVKLAVSYQSANVIKIKIKKNDASAFTTSGLYTLTDGSNCGAIIGTANIAVGDLTKEITVNLSFSSGYKDIWGSFTNASGTKYNAGHITICTDNTKKINTGHIIYYSQLDPACPNSTYRSWGCLPASCMMGAHLTNPSFNVNATVFQAMCTGMGTVTGGTFITAAANYLKQNSQFGAAQLNPYVTTNITNARTTLMDYLAGNKSVTCLVKYNASTKTITSAGNVEHFVLVVGATHTGNNQGTIFYYDPYGNAGLKSMSMSSFLAAMPAASLQNAYNMLRIG